MGVFSTNALTSAHHNLNEIGVNIGIGISIDILIDILIGMHLYCIPGSYDAARQYGVPENIKIKSNILLAFLKPLVFGVPRNASYFQRMMMFELRMTFYRIEYGNVLTVASLLIGRVNGRITRSLVFEPVFMLYESALSLI